MPYRLTYTAQLQQTDNSGVPNGATYSFSGSQADATNSPQTADLTALATAMGADIGAQMAAGYPIQAVDDSAAAASGGRG